MKRTIALPPFLPDQSANSGALSEASGVYPRPDGYGPINALASQSDALPAAFAGGASFVAGDGTASLFIGTANGLERFNSGAWASVLSGLSVTRWDFVQFGNYAVAVNGSDTKVIDLTAGTASALTGAPAGVAVTVVGDYVVIGQDAGDLLGVYYSAANDHTDWTPALGGPGIQPMLTGGEVMGLAGGEFGVILQRERLVRMSVTGDADAPFQFDEITRNVGCASKGSVAQFGNTVFFLANSGFKALDAGQDLRHIGSEKVDATFMAQVARDDWEQIWTTVDPERKLVKWCVPGSPGKLWIYNFELDRWATATLPIEGVFSGFTASLSLEAVSALYPDIDTMPYSLDDPRFSGGAPRLYGVVGGELCTFTGDALGAAFQFSFQEFVSGRTTRLKAVRPVGDAVDGHTLTVDCRARLGDAENVKTAADIRDSGVMPIRASGRYMRPRHLIAAGTDWTYAQGLEFDLEVGGGR